MCIICVEQSKSISHQTGATIKQTGSVCLAIFVQMILRISFTVSHTAVRIYVSKPHLERRLLNALLPQLLQEQQELQLHPGLRGNLEGADRASVGIAARLSVTARLSVPARLNV